MKNKYLIIGGTTKAATTSIFYYLKDHPQVDSSSVKETRYFLDLNYPLKRPFKFDGIDGYRRLFKGEGEVRMESTPDYLYSQNTPEKIKKCLLQNEVYFVFSLRDPIDRLVSWYKFAKQNNFLDSNISFEEYVDIQKNSPCDVGTPQHLRALEQGRYFSYLQNYTETFKYIKVVFYEDLKRDEVSTLKEIASFSGLEPDFYNNYKFKVTNKSRSLRSPKIHSLYIGMRDSVRTYSHRAPFFHKFLQILRKGFDSFYYKINEVKETEEITMNPSTLAFLKDYYSEDIAMMERYYDLPRSWKKNYFNIEV